jgi:GNAT superfamily N-acetyltransferase
VIDVVALRRAYDELRGHLPDVPAGVHAERDGPLVRSSGWPRGGLVEYRDLRGLEGAALDALIARQVQVFAELGESFEWKYHAHDRPADLPERLRAAGLVAAEEETLLVAPVEAVAAEPVLPPGVALRRVTSDGDFERVAALEERIWGDDFSWLAAMLTTRQVFSAANLSVYVAEADGEVVSAAWVRFRNESFATLHGGGTLPAWRGRGIYRALVARRAALALERGIRYLAVDTTDESRAVLERAGFVVVGSTTPFVWSPVPFAP